VSITLSGSTYWSRPRLHRVEESGKGTILAWVRFGDNDDTQMFLFSVSNTLTVERDASNKIVVSGRNVTHGAKMLELTSTTSYTESDTWYCIAASWDLAEGEGHLYVNREDDLASSTVTSSFVDLDAPPAVLGAQYDYTLGWVGDIHEFVFWDAKYLDLSDSDEIIKIISSDGLDDYANPGPTSSTPKPVGLGERASMPFNQPATVLFSGAFTGNRGTGGKFTQTGTFDWVDADDDVSTYRQSGAPNAVPGQRSFDSERTGWTYARHDTFVERRSGLSDFGKRLGISERAHRSRRERPGHEQNFTRLIRGDEDDTEDRR